MSCQRAVQFSAVDRKILILRVLARNTAKQTIFSPEDIQVTDGVITTVKGIAFGWPAETSPWMIGQVDVRVERCTVFTPLMPSRNIFGWLIIQANSRQYDVDDEVTSTIIHAGRSRSWIRAIPGDSIYSCFLGLDD